MAEQTPKSRPGHTATRGDVTELLVAVEAGEQGAFDRLFAVLYADLKRIARGQLRRRRPGHTLDTTAIVHESYFKFVDQSAVRWEGRSHFYAVAARAMRQVIVDYARRVGRAKRGGGAEHVAVDERKLPALGNAQDVLDIDAALEKLAVHSPRLAQVVMYRFFAGLDDQEIGELLGVTDRTVRNDWARAKAWLKEAMSA